MSAKIEKSGKRKLLQRGDPLRDNIVRARNKMLEELPFFGNIAMYLQPLETEEVPTAAVTHDRKFLINRKFTEKATPDDLVFILSHEAMHLASEHTGRQPIGVNSSPAHVTYWLWATDLSINFLLANPDKGMGMPLPRKELIEPLYEQPEFRKFWGKSAEEIYYQMVKEQFQMQCPKCGKSIKDNQKKDGSDSCSGKGKEEESKGSQNGDGSCKHWWDDTAHRCEQASEEEREVWKNIVQRAAEAAKQAGNLPGVLSDFVTEITQPKRDWRKELQYFVSSFCKRRYDWKVRNRRTISSGIVTPGKSPFLPQGVCGIDTSGSMSDEQIRKCIIEHAGILDASGGEGTLALFDSELYHFGEVSVASLSRLPVQRGGTNFIPFFEKIEEENIKPAYVVVFTDLYGPWPDDPPEYPVIICRTPDGAEEPPWPSCRMIDLDFS